ncbi:MULTISPECIES: cobalamin biosynthesis protein CbiX [unclassified Streptomyces]|uniref:cobalamin biosynthesis protein CbiX n=1 Tax=unclassified Streptomyces TaxID=2593676 RepID=UPI0022526973|nr:MULTISPECIES: cobalamin biosynthesis protein CbiX [unclassified Streptomyces]WSP59283.1 cobalamin biosynthesis protein CbiX [Streptomyces sp. NBC_01241]MCX4791035.1 cobalamin biosynthesis protein CbiX [Streptomyces sp. NBC_01221]MCX4793240.1 cobalamin biosynthesis protein CbiX [Streptomyces sp. NBC_01242]WSJ34684.1 cobalamin biosynthesis protein CbiX [Streptomyces sp. NBC_01321]WSP61126.1 cobalamin biosynthesis protein CbiX [Streptomyces sp. NBC_01240]
MSDHCRVIAVCGHEAAHGKALHGLVDPAVIVVPSGRELYRSIAGLTRGGEQGCVVPMTLGRDPELVADTARTLRALPAAERSATVLAEPFGTSQYLIGWLRAAAGRVPATSALLVTAPAGDPFDDAELYRVASLVRRYGSHPLVEVAFSGGDPDPAEGVRRCRLLGASRVVLLPAAFALPEVPDVPGTHVERAGPPVPPAALARILAERVAAARRRWNERGDDGIATGLTAADDHGHSHTHPPGEDHGHGLGHLHTHQHPHVHGAGQVIRSTA